VAQVAGTPAVSPPVEAGARRRGRFGDRVFRGSTLVIGAGLILLLFLILGVLLKGGAEAFRTFGLELVTGKHWNPVAGRQDFGALPFIVGTLITSTVAVVLAVPISVGLALLLTEMPSGWLRNPLAVFVDLLAAIPSVVYGLWGFYFLVPLFDSHVEPFLSSTLGNIPVVGALFENQTGSGGNIFVAGVILAIMIIPIVTAVTREVVTIVPRELREGAMALGATRYETIRMSVLPYARSGIVGASMLGLGRALGETIAVVLLLPQVPIISEKILQNGGATVSGFIALRAGGDAFTVSGLMAAGLVLFVITLGTNMVASVVVARSRSGAGVEL
jgi:phosphate transport system permease protein